MKAKLRSDIKITATHEGGSFWIIDDSIIFQVRNINDRKVYFFPGDHDLAGCGMEFKEDEVIILN
jgi:hypothetical protein